MVFCNKFKGHTMTRAEKSHNPYFNRWFSAIDKVLSDLHYQKESQSLF